jgi:hypothetical protein
MLVVEFEERSAPRVSQEGRGSSSRWLYVVADAFEPAAVWLRIVKSGVAFGSYW